MENNATKMVAEYIKNNKIPAFVISEKLGIPVDKLLYVHGESLNATEFLEVCEYLNVRPEMFRIKTISGA